MLSIKIICILAFIILCAVNAAFIQRKIGLPPARPANTGFSAPIWGSITQILDHYSSSDSRTWSQRYLYSDQFFQSGGPIFVFIGGEWEIDETWLLTGQMVDMARYHSGYMFYLEHRFYGSSFPLGDFSTNSLKYIRSRQALADLANFIVTMKNDIDGISYSKVVVVGGSYSASLATWARLLYPDIIDIAYASSAPLIALEDFYKYYEVVGLQMYINSNDCYYTNQEAIDEMDRLFQTNEGIQYLEQVFDTCRPIRNVDPYKAHLFLSLTNSWASLVQYARPGDILRECDILLDKPGDSFQKVVAYYKEQLGKFCMGDYEEYVDFYSNTTLSTFAGRQWQFQTCEEFGFFQTTASLYQPFGNNVLVNYYESLCRDIYGPEYTPNQIRNNIAYTNSIYGELNYNLTYVISVHGNVDPWHTIGLTSDLHSLAPAYLVDGTSHCEDLNSASGLDSQEMASVKQAVKDKIAEWLG